LPEKVTLQLSDGTTKDAPVTWTSTTYDKNTPGTYEFVGAYDLPTGVTGDKVGITMNVVLKDLTAPDVTITSVKGMKDIIVRKGTKLESIYLPKMVILNLSDGTTKVVPVTWTSNDYNKDKPGMYKVIGSYDLPVGVTGNKVDAVINIVVKDKNNKPKDKYPKKYKNTGNHGKKVEKEVKEIPVPETPVAEDTPKAAKTVNTISYVKGYPDGTFKPQKNISRAEAATMFAKLLTLDAIPDLDMNAKDVEKGAWYEDPIAYLTSKGFIKGYEDGSIQPNTDITRGEFAQMLSKFLKPVDTKTPFKDADNHWAAEAIRIAYGNGIIKGYEDGSFKPDQKITRAEAVTMLNRAFNKYIEMEKLNQLAAEKALTTFTDVPEDFWAYKEILVAANKI
ncbi:MAG: S-layer homology domain-containing protein, partial [Tissierellia bacterium]|nr:S-layer homology domain-containing protein [Tissierellia bacterium]